MFKKKTARSGVGKPPAYISGAEPKTVIAALRYQLKLTQKEFADLLGISYSHISSIENGKKLLSIQHAKRVQHVGKLQGIQITLEEIYSNVDLGFNTNETNRKAMLRINKDGKQNEC